jgi:hypothetical protein
MSAGRGRVWPLLIAAILLAGMMGRAEASCGDYLHVGGAKMADGASAHDEPKSPRPCRGPGCREGHRQGPLAPTAPVELNRITDQLLHASVDQDSQQNEIRRPLIDVSASRSKGHLLEVNRPPEHI